MSLINVLRRSSHVCRWGNNVRSPTVLQESNRECYRRALRLLRKDHQDDVKRWNRQQTNKIGTQHEIGTRFDREHRTITLIAIWSWQKKNYVSNRQGSDSTTIIMTQQPMASIASTISWRFCQQVLVVMIVIQVMAAIWIASIAPKTIGHSKFFSTESWLISSSSSQESLRRPQQVIHNKFNSWSINGNKGHPDIGYAS